MAFSMDNSVTNYMVVVGWITILFSTIDYYISEIILRLINDPDPNRLPFTDKTTLGRKLCFIEKLRPEQVTNIEALSAIQALLPEAMKISEERNRYIHDQWILKEALLKENKICRIRLRVTPDHKICGEETLLSMDDLQKCFAEIGELQKKIIAIDEILSKM